ncbi:MAG TPA: hypothetical protein VKB35_03030 [Ktedonobacteraceae bacterium]|nr:hypothetical protein [Ktedonobacteraceae bacterium]
MILLTNELLVNEAETAMSERESPYALAEVYTAAVCFMESHKQVTHLGCHTVQLKSLRCDLHE